MPGAQGSEGFVFLGGAGSICSHHSVGVRDKGGGSGGLAR